MHREKVVAELLRQSRALPPDIIERAIALRGSGDKEQRLEAVLVAGGLADEATVAKGIAEGLGFPFRPGIDPATLPIDWLRAIRFDLPHARRHRLVPLEADPSSVTIAVADPLATEPIDDLRAVLGLPVEVVVSTPTAILDALSFLQARLGLQSELGGQAASGPEIPERADLLTMKDDAEMIRWVSAIFIEALRERATDIHIQPDDDLVAVRFRVDGELHRAKTAPRKFLPGILARIKVMSGLDIAETRLPQDGRIGFRVGGKDVDVRVSTIPLGDGGGERAALRLLDRTATGLRLTDLGFAPDHLDLMRDLVSRPGGMVLVSGPTGAGKTTTLYACVNEVNRPNVNILTAENPIEYALTGVSQMQVHAKIGLDFASCLRAFLRQDPDVILVGEIRDGETAEVAVQAALTGHLVLSTIHTKDAAGVATRLEDLGVEGFYVSSTLEGAVAQRLVRVLCPSCKEPRPSRLSDLARLGVDQARLAERLLRSEGGRSRVFGGSIAADAARTLVAGGEAILYAPRGCPACHDTGYRGRTGLYEILLVNEAIRDLLLHGADAAAIRRAAIAAGMDTLRDDGVRKVLEGVTSVDEVLGATQEG